MLAGTRLATVVTVPPVIAARSTPVGTVPGMSTTVAPLSAADRDEDVVTVAVDVVVDVLVTVVVVRVVVHTVLLLPPFPLLFPPLLLLPLANATASNNTAMQEINFIFGSVEYISLLRGFQYSLVNFYVLDLNLVWVFIPNERCYGCPRVAQFELLFILNSIFRYTLRYTSTSE